MLIDEDGFIVIGPDGKPLRKATAVNQFAAPQKKKQGEIGNSSRNVLTATARVIKANVFATRYHPGTTADEVKDDLKNDTRIKDFDICVETVKTKYDTYASFHVTCVCKEEEAKIFFESDLWPPGILYREWKEKRVFNYQESGGFPYRGAGFQHMR